MQNENSGEINVEARFEGVRLDNHLSSLLPSVSRSKVQSLIKSDNIRLNGKKTKSSVKLSEGDLITYDLQSLDEDKARPPSQKDIGVEIVFEDDHLLVVNKPAGLITHPGIGNTDESLVHAFYNKLLKNDPVRPGIVHRLDKETSGLLVMAKTQESFDSLSRQFKDKTARRTYWALHFGKLKSDEGSWDSFLARSPRNRVKFSSQENGKQAITHYKKIHQGPVSITELSLDTGRTHQIRVHMSEANLPILNDELYGSQNNLKSILDVELRTRLKKVGRMALVARRLSFTHPESEEAVSFEVPWPDELNVI